VIVAATAADRIGTTTTTDDVIATVTAQMVIEAVTIPIDVICTD
jgi:hypothetical protein